MGIGIKNLIGGTRTKKIVKNLIGEKDEIQLDWDIKMVKNLIVDGTKIQTTQIN